MKRFGRSYRSQEGTHQSDVGFLHNEHPTKNTKRQYIQQWLLRDGIAIVGIVFCFGILLWNIDRRTHFARITNIHIDGNHYIATEDIQKHIQELFSGRIWGIVPKNIYGVISTKDITQSLELSFSDTYRFEHLSVTRKFPHDVYLFITERTPSVLWITNNGAGDQYYIVDRRGVVIEHKEHATDWDDHAPRIRDENRPSLGIGWWIIHEEYLNFIFAVQKTLIEKAPDLSIRQFNLSRIQCQEQQFVAENADTQAFLDQSSDEFRTKKREIQKLFQEGKISIDESLERLDNIKNEEISRKQPKEGSSSPTLIWKTIYNEVPCDIVKVATEVHIDVRDVSEKKNFSIYITKTIDVQSQIERALQVLRTEIDHTKVLDYIDARYNDRAYIHYR